MASPSPRPLYQRPLFITAAIFVLLLSGGAFYYVDYVDGNSGRKPAGPAVPVQAQRDFEHPVFDVQNLKGISTSKPRASVFTSSRGP